MISAEELAYLHSKFPSLKGTPDSILRKMDFAGILMLHDALGKESRDASRQDTGQKLASNAAAMRELSTIVETGEDNRFDKLHPCRFIGGAGCSSQAMWLRAREILGNKGVKPIGCYDMDAIGSGGSVTARAWMEIHNPASLNLKLKLFHMANVGTGASASKRISLADGDTSLDVGDSFKEVTELEEFKCALEAARSAMAFALPWNHSITAITGFMKISQFCAKELGGNAKRAAILSAFVDHVFHRNAENWVNNRAHLSTNQLTTAWSSWYGQRSATFLPPGGAESFRKPDSLSKGEKKKKEKDDLCRRYNSVGGCPNVATNCHTLSGKPLRHLCNANIGGGRKCAKNHTRMDHK
jgi:hypothetical protein